MHERVPTASELREAFRALRREVTSGELAAPERTSSPAAPGTRTGVILGTAAYMSRNKVSALAGPPIRR